MKAVSVYDILIKTFEKSKHLSNMLYFVFRGPWLLPSLCINCLLSSSTFYIWILSSETLLFCRNDICGVLYKKNYSFYFDLAKKHSYHKHFLCLIGLNFKTHVTETTCPNDLFVGTCYVCEVLCKNYLLMSHSILIW